MALSHEERRLARDICADLRAYGLLVLESDVEQIMIEIKEGNGCRACTRRSLHDAIKPRVRSYVDLTKRDWRAQPSNFNPSATVRAYYIPSAQGYGTNRGVYVCLDPTCLFYFAGYFNQIADNVRPRPVALEDTYDEGAALTCTVCDTRLDGEQ